MVLSHEEFIRRFAMHILPKRFVKKSVIMVFEQHLETKTLKTLQQKLGIQRKEKPIAKAVFNRNAVVVKQGI